MKIMSDTLAREFWQRIDDLRRGDSLKDIASKAGLNYDTLRNKRSGKISVLPNLTDAYSLAQTLGVSMEFLLTGKDSTSSIQNHEAKAVEESPELQALVRAVMRDPQLLSALATVIESSERANIG